MPRHDDEIFRKLNKEKPLARRKDIEPLSEGDFDPSKSSFDLLVEDFQELLRSGERNG